MMVSLASANRDETIWGENAEHFDLDPFRQRVLVNKGSRDGVFRGQAALDPRHTVFQPGHPVG